MKLSLLVIEDNPIMLMFLGETLQEHDFALRETDRAA